ncbi:hypothetical protein E2C01_068374 [Portunus trituberculatus]|uniref:Uncharacterized protein n=1 Tax=Portunus trituberculatus TaxID=210409 RepID=A0A5B7HWA4_PORTR|nr:hypothetical protein [Portunus trituberculatus]
MMKVLRRPGGEGQWMQCVGRGLTSPRGAGEEEEEEEDGMGCLGRHRYVSQAMTFIPQTFIHLHPLRTNSCGEEREVQG